MKFMFNILLFWICFNYILSKICDDYYKDNQVSKQDCLKANVSEIDGLNGKNCCYTIFLDENSQKKRKCGAIKKDTKVIKDQIDFMEKTFQYKNVKIICFSFNLKYNFIFLILFIFIL